MKYLFVEMYISNDSTRCDEFIVKLKTEQYDACVFYAPTEWEYFFTNHDKKLWNTIVEIISERGKKLEVITGAAKILYGEPKLDFVTVHSWDTYFITATYHWWKDNIRELKPYSYKYIYMNNNAHAWRCKLIDLVAKNNLINCGAVSWNKLNNNYAWKYFEQKILTLSDSFQNSFDYYSLPKEYDNSFMQLVSESTINALFITEKTAVPLLTKKPFLVASVPGYHAHLKKLGFELYDEIFDYSFDEEIDEDIRYQRLLDNLIKISRYSNEQLNSLYNQIEEKLTYNKNRAIEIATKNINKPDILKILPLNIWDFYDKIYNNYVFVNVYPELNK